LHVWTGAFVEPEGLGMINPDSWDMGADLFIQAQRQSGNAFELRFLEVVRIQIVSVPPGFSHELAGATLVSHEGLFYWAESSGWDPAFHAGPSDITWIAARKLFWRFRPDWLGPTLRYSDVPIRSR